MKYDLTKLVDLTALNTEELVEAAHANDPSALFLASYLYRGGFNITPIDWAEALACAKAGADLGDGLCTAQYGSLLYHGVGVTSNELAGAGALIKARHELNRLIKKGSPYAMSLEADRLIHIMSPAAKPDSARKKIIREAVALDRTAAQKGDVVSQLRLASIAARGNPSQEGLDWLKKAIKAKHGSAEEYMGDILSGNAESTLPIAPSKARGLIYYRRAALQGYPHSQCYVGAHYYAEKRYEQAFAYLDQAHTHGVSLAQPYLASMHKDGMGVKKDPVEAFSLFSNYLLGHMDNADQSSAFILSIKSIFNELLSEGTLVQEDNANWLSFSDENEEEHPMVRITNHPLLQGPPKPQLNQG